jgi:hypothetical protein
LAKSATLDDQLSIAVHPVPYANLYQNRSVKKFNDTMHQSPAPNPEKKQIAKPT